VAGYLVVVITLDIRLVRLGRSCLAQRQALYRGIPGIDHHKGRTTLDWLIHDHRSIRKIHARQAHHPDQAADHRCMGSSSILRKNPTLGIIDIFKHAPSG